MENIKTNPVTWFEIYVQDMERAKKFYQEVFKFSLTQIESPDIPLGTQVWRFPLVENQIGASGALVKKEGVTSGEGGIRVYFNANDCADEEARVEAAGGKILKNKFSIGRYGFMSLIYDTEGNVIGIYSYK